MIAVYRVHDIPLRTVNGTYFVWGKLDFQRVYVLLCGSVCICMCFVSGMCMCVRKSERKQQQNSVYIDFTYVCFYRCNSCYGYAMIATKYLTSVNRRTRLTRAR